MTKRDETPCLPPPEFSRPVLAESLSGDRTVREIEASPAECRALAERFRLVAVQRLTATVRLTRLHGHESGMVRVGGTLEAEVVQTCVVTLEPVPASVSEAFDALFAPEDKMPEAGDDLSIDPFAAEETLPEAMAGGVIDIGELVAQHLSLALDPYPRAAGVEFTGFDDDGEPEGGPETPPPSSSPFGALAALKRRH